MNSQNDFSVEKKYKSPLVQANLFPSRPIFFKHRNHYQE